MAVVNFKDYLDLINDLGKHVNRTQLEALFSLALIENRHFKAKLIRQVWEQNYGKKVPALLKRKARVRILYGQRNSEKYKNTIKAAQNLTQQCRGYSESCSNLRLLAGSIYDLSRSGKSRLFNFYLFMELHTNLDGPIGSGLEYRAPPVLNAPTITEETAKAIREQLDTKQAARANLGKLRWSLIPLEVFAPVVEVLMFGAKKYAAWNFTNGNGLSWTEVGESLQRHINAWMSGEDNDPESGLSHLGHIGCNLLFLLYYKMYASKGYEQRDDRFKR